jgi:diguanylate cyclase (GGDEF)-like protein
MDTRISAYSGYRYARQPELKPVAVTRWTARLVDPNVEQAFLESRFHEDRRRVLILFGFIATAGGLIIGGRFIAYLGGFGAWTTLLPPLVPVAVATCGLCILLRMKTAQALQLCLLGVGAITILVRFTNMTLQPSMVENWLPLMVTSIFTIYIYLPVRLVTATGFATFYSVVSVIWWSSFYGATLGTEQIYFGILWVTLANGLGFTAANTLQRSQRTQYAQSLMLRHLLSTDAMTGIGNRRRFDDALDREWRRCSRSGKPLSLLMIDVDHFKAYNDHCGHLQGDDCLRRVAWLLVDSVGRPGDLVARYGGEEFVCLLPEIGESGARAVAAKLSGAVQEAAIPHPAFAGDGRLTISIGVATVTDLSMQQPGEVVALADKLLYAAKAAGRDQVMTGAL